MSNIFEANHLISGEGLRIYFINILGKSIFYYGKTPKTYASLIGDISIIRG
jgi:hypothetical protein